MDFQTFLTIVLGSGFACGVAVAAYALSIGKIDPRLARRGVSIAWVFGAVLCVWFGGTNNMPPLWRYTIAAAVSAVLTVGCSWALDHIHDRNAAAVTNDLDFQITLNCEPFFLDRVPLRAKDTQLIQVDGLPRQGQRTSETYVRNTLNLGGVSSSPFPPNWPIWVCRVTNYSKTLLSGMKATFQIEWATSYQPGLGSAGTLGKAPFTLLSLQFSPDDQSDTFYIFSVSRSYVIVSLPHEVDVRVVGSDYYQRVKLIRRNEARDEGFVLQPNPNIKEPKEIPHSLPPPESR